MGKKEILKLPVLELLTCSKIGLPGIALGAGLAGYDAYKNYQNQEGMIYNLFNRDE